MSDTATITAPACRPSVLQDSRSKLYYNRDLGGFSESDKSKATVLDNASQVAFIKAHFQRPEFIEAVPVDSEPTPDNAHLNQHLNGTVKVVRHPSARWDSKSYTFGDWSIHCYQWNQNKGAHRCLKATRRNYVPLWEAHNRKTKESFTCEDGGIKLAIKKLIRHEMKRHNLA